MTMYSLQHVNYVYHLHSTYLAYPEFSVYYIPYILAILKCVNDTKSVLAGQVPGIFMQCKHTTVQIRNTKKWEIPRIVNSDNK